MKEYKCKSLLNNALQIAAQYKMVLTEFDKGAFSKYLIKYELTMAEVHSREAAIKVAISKRSFNEAVCSGCFNAVLDCDHIFLPPIDTLVRGVYSSVTRRHHLLSIILPKGTSGCGNIVLLRMDLSPDADCVRHQQKISTQCQSEAVHHCVCS